MTTIRKALSEFLTETGPGNARSASSPWMIVDLFATYLDQYGHESLDELVQVRLAGEDGEDSRFCDTFGPDLILPSQINSFLSTFVVSKVMAGRDFLIACGPVMDRLAAWLLQRGYWDEEALGFFRAIAGTTPGSDLGGCDALGDALYAYVESHPVNQAGSTPYDDYLDDRFTIMNVEQTRLVLEHPFADGEEIKLSLPKSVLAKARPGWSITLELARYKSRWRILSVGHVYP